MSEEIKKNRRVTILAVKNNYRTGIPFYVTPIYRASDRNFLTGLEEEFDSSISAARRGKILKTMGYDSKPETLEDMRIPINHGKILSLDNDEDFGTYRLCIVSPDIANNQKSIDPDTHLFYLSDPEGEASVNLTHEIQMIDAKSKIINEGGDFEKLRALALFLGGIDLQGLSLNVVTSRVLKEADTRPEKVLEFYKGGHGHHVMVKELEYFNILTLKEGKFYDGEKYLGTLQEAIAFVSDPNNTDITNSLAERLIEAKKTK